MSRVWTMSTVYSAVLPPSFGIYFISLRLCPFPPFTPKHPKNVFFCFTKSEQWAIPLQKYCKFNFGQSCLDCKDLPPRLGQNPNFANLFGACSSTKSWEKVNAPCHWECRIILAVQDLHQLHTAVAQIWLTGCCMLWLCRSTDPRCCEGNPSDSCALARCSPRCTLAAPFYLQTSSFYSSSLDASSSHSVQGSCATEATRNICVSTRVRRL